MAVVHHHRTIGADHLDPRGGEVWVAERQAPAAANHHRHAVVQGDHHPLLVGHVAAIAAGESLLRPLILVPSMRVMWRETSAVTGLPMVPSRMHLRTYAYFGLKRCE